MTDSQAPVLFDVRGAVATLTLNLGERMNPLTSVLLQGCQEALQRVRDDTSIRALILTARGKAFCAGADLTQLGQWAKESGAPGQPSVGEQVARLMETEGNPFMTGLRTLPVPVVCAINGAAAGGGFGVALAGDIVIAARSAFFYLPFVPSLGIVPDMGSTWMLPRAVGRARAMGLTLLGDRLSAEQAAQWGLIWACVDDASLADEAMRIATRLAALPVHAAAEVRALFRASEANDFETHLAYERDRQRELIDGECFAEGVSAFNAKRRPVFPGRRS